MSHSLSYCELPLAAPITWWTECITALIKKKDGFKHFEIKNRQILQHIQGFPFSDTGFRREADQNCALLGCYAACGGNFLPTFRDNLSGPILRVQESPEDGTDRLCRNVCNNLLPLAA